ncbi:hypothetical protein J1N35_029514 [Gossypium stocksii]|uniref:Reverse transcriptase zinc-binding domain-containing protein n=1 Tax=Gossypium stocksii TaxID=47602 RepID=A0A9D3UZ27_9ROSI|nr:hypothetical protein J1N35_029514 [Gossypium stocksii]
MRSTVILKGVCTEMEKIIRSFVWGHTKKKRISLVKWEEICKDTKNVSLSSKKIGCHNDSFLMKIGFNIVKKPKQLLVVWSRVREGIVLRDNGVKE